MWRGQPCFGRDALASKLLAPGDYTLVVDGAAVRLRLVSAYNEGSPYSRCCSSSSDAIVAVIERLIAARPRNVIHRRVNTGCRFDDAGKALPPQILGTSRSLAR